MKFLFKIALLLLSVQTTLYANTPLNIESFTTATGVPVMFYQTMDVPMLDINIAFHAGSAFDGQQFGLSALTTHLLNQGSSHYTANQIADQLASVGAQYKAESNRDMILIGLKTLSKPDALTPAIQTLASTLQYPDFPEDAFLAQKKQQFIRIQHVQESAEDLGDQTFFQALYQAHPYAHPIDGNATTLDTITKADVQHFYQRFFTKKNVHIVLVGAINKTKALEIANTLTQHLPTGQKASSTPLARPLSTEMDIEVPFDSSQTVIRVGHLGMNHQNQHYFALIVGNHILGGGSLVSQLAHELREKRGLTYGAYSEFTPMPGIGPFIIRLSTRHTQAKLAETLTRDTLATFIKNGPSKQELMDAKAYLTGGFPVALASNESLAAILIKINFYDLPKDYLNHYIEHINAVTEDEIKQAFQAQIDPAKLLQVSVGKP